MAMPSGMRIGDAEREAAAAELREHFALGRLNSAEFQERLDAVFAAKTDTDLDKITADLPGNRRRPAFGPPASSQVRDSSQAPGPAWDYPVTFGRRRRSGAWPVILIVIVVLVALPEGSGALAVAPVPILVIAAILFLTVRSIARARGRRHIRYRNWDRF